MAEFLELPHLVDEHRVPEMQIRRGGIEARLDAQRLAASSFRQQLRLEQQSDVPRFSSASCSCCSMIPILRRRATLGR